MRKETVPNARAFVRSFNVLLKFARLYGLTHTRSAGQLDLAWSELRECLAIHGETGLLLGVSGSQLLLDGEPLESTAAERSFAGLLTTAGVASIGFMQRVTKEDFANLILAFTETGPKAGALAERLEKAFGSSTSTGIRVNEIRFVAEDSSFSQTQLAAQLTAATLGAEATDLRDWFRSPEKMIQLIAAAEGAHGHAASGGSGGSGTVRDFGSASGGAGGPISSAASRAGTGVGAPGGVAGEQGGAIGNSGLRPGRSDWCRCRWREDSAVGGIGYARAFAAARADGRSDGDRSAASAARLAGKVCGAAGQRAGRPASGAGQHCGENAEYQTG